jgi:predicted nucleic acid-binding protein
MNIVLDTNLFVAAGFNPYSSSAAILRAVENGAHTLVWNAATQAETRKIVTQIPRLSWDHFAGLFAPEHEYAAPTYPEDFVQVVDRDDRKFAALAAATASTLITNDDHLLAIRDTFPGAILTPREFTDQYGD